MTDQRIAEIAARCEAATPGPWEWKTCGDTNMYVEAECLKGVISLEDDYPGYPEYGEHLIMELLQADADFIAHAREDIPALLAEVRRLQAQLAERNKECETQYELLAEKNQQLAASQRREKAAVRDLSTYKDCGFCMHLQDQQYCYKNCQRHVDVDNFRTHPCWQWRGCKAEEGETNAP